jgi:hypothetical protein
MSTSLYWEPIKPQRSKSLGQQLKYIFGPRYWGHDGTCNGEEIILSGKEIPYLTGISDGTRDTEIKGDIDVLIEAIQKYGSVKIWLEG